MADGREVYAWPELRLFLFSGATSALAAFAESVEVTVEDPHRKFLYSTTGVGFAARSELVHTDRNVRMNVGALYAGQSLSNLSGVNISATVNLTGVDVTATFILWSARRTNFQLQGRDGGLWRQTISLIAPDISGL